MPPISNSTRPVATGRPVRVASLLIAPPARLAQRRAYSTDEVVPGLVHRRAHRLAIQLPLAGHGHRTRDQVDVDLLHAGQRADLLRHRLHAVTAGHPLHLVRRRGGGGGGHAGTPRRRPAGPRAPHSCPGVPPATAARTPATPSSPQLPGSARRCSTCPPRPSAATHGSAPPPGAAGPGTHPCGRCNSPWPPPNPPRYHTPLG